MNKKLACITIDIEPDLGDPEKRIRLFDDPTLYEQYKVLIKKHDVKVTGFLVTCLLKRYGPAIDRFVHHHPLEFGVHSHSHDQKRACTEEEVSRSYRAYHEFFGAPPLGYRTPNGLINKSGLNHLLDYEFVYDSSVLPSLRFDEYRYSNLGLPNAPFQFVRGRRTILELPGACLQTIRLVFSLSYCKLLGLSAYRVLMNFFPLPEIVILASHPYDFYIPVIVEHLKGWKKFAHLRNSQNAFALFDAILGLLRQQGYEFIFMSELVSRVKQQADILQVSINELA